MFVCRVCTHSRHNAFSMSTCHDMPRSSSKNRNDVIIVDFEQTATTQSTTDFEPMSVYMSNAATFTAMRMLQFT